MLWRKAPVIVVTLLYIVQGVIYIVNRQWAQAMVFGGYALANVGIIAAL